MKEKRRSKKESREHQALIGLVELYLKTGKPVGSSTLKETGFEDLSSATLRNYFAELETQGYLKQPHTSGGRIPTDKAYRFYADHVIDEKSIDSHAESELRTLRKKETKAVSHYLQTASELFSEVTGLATFLSSVRFDQDFILDVKFLGIDATRILCVLITDFGQVLTEILNTPHKLSAFSLKRLESYFQAKLKKKKENLVLSSEEQEIASTFYNEIMVRYLVHYSNFSDEDLYRTGFSKLLNYPEFNDLPTLSSALSLFENSTEMRKLLNDCIRKNHLCYWVGNDLDAYMNVEAKVAAIAIPYRINHIPVGAVAVLGPTRIPYRHLFGMLHYFSEVVSDTLTKSLYKFKLTFRHPQKATSALTKTPGFVLELKGDHD